MQPLEFYKACPDLVIVSMAREGDDLAFEELLVRRQQSVRSLMRRLCRDTVLADDLSQQVFLQMWRKLKSLKETSAFDGWLRRVAINTWQQHVRKFDALSDADDEFETTTSSTPALSRDLNTALESLPHNARLCVVLSYHEGMTHEEIAEISDMPLGTVKSHITRGVKLLREQLIEYRNVESNNHEDSA